MGNPEKKKPAQEDQKGKKKAEGKPNQQGSGQNAGGQKDKKPPAHPKEAAKAAKRDGQSSGQSQAILATPVLQAVVIADSFNHRFCPITFDRPRCLLPLANVPIIEYTLEFLDANGVEEIFVFCCAHADKIEAYLIQSGWTKRKNPRVKIIKGGDCSSVGDALRFMDQLDVIKDTFVLVNGDVISNANIKSALEQHRIKREADRSIIMTMILKTAALNHRSRTIGESPRFGIDPLTTQLLYYENNSNPTIKLEYKQIFEKNRQRIDLRADLYDCRIDICSKEVLLHMQENFDFSDLRTDFVRGVLGDEVVGYKIFTYVTSSEYAGEVSCLKTYDTVSKDIIQRWSYPLVPDNNFTNKTDYTLSPNRIYMEPKVGLAQSTRIGGDTIIGARAVIGENSVVSSSVIGRNCVIGANCVIEGSYIWDDVVIGDNCRIVSSIVADKATIGSNSTLALGCIVSFDVKVAPGTELPEHSKITIATRDTEDAFFLREGPESAQSRTLPSGGVGRFWEENEDEEGVVGNYIGAKPDPITDDQTDESDYGDSDEEEDEEDAYFPKIALANIVSKFIRELINANDDFNKTQVELQSQRLTLNMSLKIFSGHLMVAFLDQLQITSTDSQDLLNAFYHGILARKSLFLQLFQSFGSSNEAQVYLLNAIVEYQKVDYTSAFLNILNALYDKEIVTEDAIFEWESQENARNPPLSLFIEAAAPMITWLKEAEEDE